MILFKYFEEVSAVKITIRRRRLLLEVKLYAWYHDC